MSQGVRRGRRSGTSDTRGHIVSAARNLFALHGYDGVSLRHIARAASVDAALVHHYFDGKDDLFAACIDLPADPAEVLANVVSAAPEDRAEVLILTLLNLWESPAQAALLALVRGAVGSHTQAALVREVLRRRILNLVAAGLDDADVRGALAASQLIGLMMARYVIKLDPLASATHEEVVRLVEPTIKRYLTGVL
ncbi:MULTISPECIES: TetR family transcriptional regulator [unclassified Arthrobacter]|uniref:TetR/AcrR family transcriptional regulator n=1 Tax=unclassified Arthrobacter TaxID=235627 RepID=UPI00149302E5|nr:MULTISPECIES: TetR family transcriptional regulator [unclassified Arthrobacter]MBE0008543.1 TetR/AcrR family transcriptional regulator [Arthrobacter sp. AET 35A]NOJ59225.1 TetR/AcrR family transcriptional regulator [Arthrobacter sp. 260]NOJ62283.1 TetR/AcrR family transcriptional regulator [Arthrobacter sp. 147(2020)]